MTNRIHHFLTSERKAPCMAEIRIYTLRVPDNFVSLKCKHCVRQVMLGGPLYGMIFDLLAQNRIMVYSVDGVLLHRCGRQYEWYCPKCNIVYETIVATVREIHRGALPQCHACSTELIQRPIGVVAGLPG